MRPSKPVQIPPHFYHTMLRPEGKHRMKALPETAFKQVGGTFAKEALNCDVFNVFFLCQQQTHEIFLEVLGHFHIMDAGINMALFYKNPTFRVDGLILIEINNVIEQSSARGFHGG